MPVYFKYFTALLLLSLFACGAGDMPLDDVDPSAAPLEPAFDQVNSIIQRQCVPCHSSSNADDDKKEDENNEDDAEDFLPYETCDMIVGNAPYIYYEAVEEGSMPPGAWPRLTEREKLIIKRWIENGVCAPCNPCE
jgi:uncharacterized membrane protein